MPFFNRNGENPQFPFDGYRVTLASGTSIIGGDTHLLVEQRANIWSELNEENYRLIGNTLFTIDTAEKRPDTLSGISPKLHIELTFLKPEQWYERNYVVLILDNDRTSLVDWAVANPILDSSSLFEQPPGSPSIYFDIPLVPVSRFEQQEVLPEGRTSFLDRISQWQNNEQLTFGIFSIEDKEIRDHLRHLHHMWIPDWFHPFFREEISRLADSVAYRIDRILKRNTDGDEQLQIILDDGNTRAATPQDLQQMREKTLLLCHGILSSTQGAFSGILNDPAFMAHLRQRYARNILAWDHYTLSKTTSQNASNLLGELNNLHDVELDIICHSRGAGVIRNFVENPGNQVQLSNQTVAIEKIAYVAGACLGSQLADTKNTNRLFRRLNMLFWFFDGAPIGFTKAILVALKFLATVAQKMPGVEAMNPTGKEIATLNAYGNTVAQEYHYIRANFDVRLSLLPIKLVEELLWDSGVFNGAANDLIVPYEGASASSKYLHGFSGMRDHDALPFGTPSKGQDKVWHINYFHQDATRNELRSFLP